MAPLSRRSFFKIAGLTAVVVAVNTLASRGVQASKPSLNWVAAGIRRQPRVQQRTPWQRVSGTAGHDERYLFFDPDDAAFMEAAVERLIPADEHGPGALQAGVPIFIDRQLAGAWGAGERLHRSGPWQPGSPVKGYQLPHSPAELFRNALHGIEIDLGRRPQAPLAILASLSMTSARRGFARSPANEQDAYLKTLQAGGKDLAGIPSQVFFESLLSLTIEGFFSDPMYGGDEEMVACTINDPDLRETVSGLL